MLVSQPPRLDSPVHAQQESSSGDEGQTGRVDQTTNDVGRKRGGAKFHSPFKYENTSNQFSLNFKHKGTDIK